MITHDQMIFTITQMIPQVKVADHGQKFWVGMPVSGDQQTDDAFIMQWGYEDIQKPDEGAIKDRWKDPQVQVAFSQYAKERGIQ